MKAPTRVLLVGKRHAVNAHDKSGGAIVLFEQLITDLKSLNLDIRIVDTNFRNYNGKVRTYVAVVLTVLTNIRKSDIMFVNGSNPILIQYGFVLVTLAKMFGKPIVFRFFGGYLKSYLDSLTPVLRKLCYWILQNTDIVFLETNKAVESFKHLKPKVCWFPNVRKRQLELTDRDYNKRFVFLGHVRADKGIDILLEAIYRLKEVHKSIVIHIYGPEMDYTPPEALSDIYKAHYKGALTSDEVNKTLVQYDVLVLPTLFKTEGYPGVIVEAFNAGLPVMATPMGGIPEMVDSTCGWFIEAGSVNDLVKTVLSINSEQYKLLSKEARRRFDAYDADKILNKIHQELRAIIT